MQVFGKRLSEYVRFQKPILIAILIVGLLRLVLSLAGQPVGTVRWLSMTVVALMGVFYYGIQVPRTGFGSYRHLLPLAVIQSTLSNGIVIVGLLIALATGQQNIFTAPRVRRRAECLPRVRPCPFRDRHRLDPLVGDLVLSSC